MGKRNAQEYTPKTQVKVKLNTKKNIVDKEDKYNKYYYEFDRNLPYASSTQDRHNEEEPIVEHDGMRYNPITLEDKRIPEYYKGKEGYEARKVCDNFDLSYHCGTAVTYILRAYKKHDTPEDCIKKAIAHLEFELEKLKK